MESVCKAAARPPVPALPERAGWWQRWRRARRDILAALPRRLFGARMAVWRTPLFSSVVVNEPDLAARVLVSEAEWFPKHGHHARALGDLLGRSLFTLSGPAWAERRTRVGGVYAAACRSAMALRAIDEAADAMRHRLTERAGGPVEIEAEAARAAADTIHRVLFSAPIDAAMADELLAAFRAYQATGPLLGGAALIGLPWLDRLSPRSRRQHRAATLIRNALRPTLDARRMALAAGCAPDDLATRLIRAIGLDADPEALLDEVTLAFMAGHETSAAALAWALYLVAERPDLQRRLGSEAREAEGCGVPCAAEVRRLALARDVFREALRLYPPIPMLMRRAARPFTMRRRRLPAGTIVIVSPWHLGRHERLWQDPHGFDPDRWQGGCPVSGAFLPFSAGPRVCPGAGFAMTEGAVFLSRLVREFELRPVAGRRPTPSMRVTLRSDDGIWLWVVPRGSAPGAEFLEHEEPDRRGE